MVPGDRVGAILSIKNGVMKMFGYGVYLGDVVPSPLQTGPLKCFSLLNVPSPKVLLDDGTVVWGCQCKMLSEYELKRAITLGCGINKVEQVSPRLIYRAQ